MESTIRRMQRISGMIVPRLMAGRKIEGKRCLHYLPLGLILLTLSSALSAADRTVRAGIYQNPPKIFQSKNGEPRGFFVDLLAAIARVEDWEIEYVACKWKDCLDMLETGDLDLMADVAFSAERETRFDFGSEVVFTSWSVIYAKPDREIKTIPDLHNKKVVVLKDSIQAKALRDLVGSFAVTPQFIEVDSFKQGYQLIENNEADSIAVNRFIGKKHEATYSARATSILIAPSFVNFAATKSDNRVLLGAIDRHLPGLKQNPDSVYSQAFEGWFGIERKAQTPGWIKWILAAIGIVILALVASTYAFRQMVRRKTFELENQNAELERYAYTVSHDLKTPLVTIKGFLGFLGKDIDANDKDRVKADIERINSAADTMGKLLNDLLELGRIGRVMGNPVTCNLTAIAKQAIELVQVNIDDLGIEIVIEEMPDVEGDEIRLVEVYLNLIENAIKFLGDQKSPSIHIGYVERDGMICCFVRDNGVGIDAEYHDQVFGLFERLSADVGGTGVGLALVKRIIEVHGGKIWIESDGLGLGSSVWFTLPV